MTGLAGSEATPRGGARARRGGRRRAQVRRIGRARPELDDPVAQDAVRDLQVVVELLEQLVRTPELDEVVVRFGLLTHLIGGLTGTPVVPSDEFAGAIDEVRDVRHDLLTTLGLNGRVEKQREVVDVLSARHCGRSMVATWGEPARRAHLPGACGATSCDGSGGPTSPWPCAVARRAGDRRRLAARRRSAADAAARHARPPGQWDDRHGEKRARWRSNARERAAARVPRGARGERARAESAARGRASGANRAQARSGETRARGPGRGAARGEATGGDETRGGEARRAEARRGAARAARERATTERAARKRAAAAQARATSGGERAAEKRAAARRAAEKRADGASARRRRRARERSPDGHGAAGDRPAHVAPRAARLRRGDAGGRGVRVRGAGASSRVADVGGRPWRGCRRSARRSSRPGRAR